jgi:hypothetical protein
MLDTTKNKVTHVTKNKIKANIIRKDKNIIFFRTEYSNKSDCIITVKDFFSLYTPTDVENCFEAKNVYSAKNVEITENKVTFVNHIGSTMILSIELFNTLYKTA